MAINFSVVILSRSARNLTSCLESLFRCEPEITKERVIVVDDGIDWDKCPYRGSVAIIPGPEPFGYARNANIGILAAVANDVILLNDDAALVTPGGFTKMFESETPHGIISACVDGIVGNSAQAPQGTEAIREEENALAFVCVLLRRWAIERIGLLDERFNRGYGCEDTDYCWRAGSENVPTGIHDGCMVEHPAAGALSSFRNETLGWERLFAQNRLIFERKWKGFRPDMKADVDNERVVELAYLAYNRLEFTQESFTALLRNTDWFVVKKLVVYDDGSTDGTREFLSGALKQIQPDTEVEMRKTRFGHAIAVFRDFVTQADAPLLAKIDNDTVVPEPWLNICLDLLAENTGVDLLGIEPVPAVGYDPNTSERRSVLKAEHIGGIGVFRRSAFTRFGPPEAMDVSPYAGFTQWQWDMPVIKSWVNPGLPVVVLDKINAEPWVSLSNKYIGQGWQRPMGKMYGPGDEQLWDWISEQETVCSTMQKA